MIARQSDLLDRTVRQLWLAEAPTGTKLQETVAVVAIGGYGRSQLFPFSDIDLLFCSEKPLDADSKEAVRRVSQALWDLGLRASPATRTVLECERLTPENPEFALSLLDRRFVCGNPVVFAKLNERIVSRLVAKDGKAIRKELLALTRERHSKFGNTIFHLEPNVKECPGGLRDVNVCAWLVTLWGGDEGVLENEFLAAQKFLFSLRCFLHYRHGRDDNTLDWEAQDAAAQNSVGAASSNRIEQNASVWMRGYFRHARVVHRAVSRAFGFAGLSLQAARTTRPPKLDRSTGVSVRDGKILLDAAAGVDPAAEPDTVLAAFSAVAKTDYALDFASEQRIADALPSLATQLEDWPPLWNQLAGILTAPYAGTALRAMHALGLLELILPEFHGIDALVIRDAYHRYTVDEHTFVLIDVLHDLESPANKQAPEWRVRLRDMIRELHHPGALFLAALLHDTGKGRMTESHAVESMRIASSVLKRLEVDPYDTELVLGLIEHHLEMSIALRRDIFDPATIRSLIAKVQTHEALRMLTVFTYADIQAVHPDALTPWKAENLWRLYMTSSNQLDRHVDEERIHTRGPDERVMRVLELHPSQKAEVELFLEGFPERYLSIKQKDTISQHFMMTTRFAEEPFQIAFHHNAGMSEITLVTRDKPRLFSDIAGALAGKGMNVVSAEAFANASGVVVDTFRFTDRYQTLELNLSERQSFAQEIRNLLTGRTSIETLLKARKAKRRGAPRVLVETSVVFDKSASAHSTLMQVVARDYPGLLRAIAETLSEHGSNVEVALIDTEGETAIDVFYLTYQGMPLADEQQEALGTALRDAIEANARV